MIRMKLSSGQCTWRDWLALVRVALELPTESCAEREAVAEVLQFMDIPPDRAVAALDVLLDRLVAPEAEAPVVEFAGSRKQGGVHG